MRSALRVMAVIMALMAAAPRAVWDGTKWIMRAAFGPPQAAAAGVEMAMEEVAEAAAVPAPDVDAPRSAEEIARKAAEAEMAEAVTDWGRIARRFAVSQINGEPEPSLARLDEPAAAWLYSLTRAECERVLELTPATISDHMLGRRIARGLPRCLDYPAGLPGVVLAELHGDERYESIKAQIERDPASVPGYRLAA